MPRPARTKSSASCVRRAPESITEARVIVLSGFDRDMMADKAAAAGADGYLEKGVPMREFARTVEGILTG
jgi:DNA-binding NarL/FixJ family response regulator